MDAFFPFLYVIILATAFLCVGRGLTVTVIFTLLRMVAHPCCSLKMRWSPLFSMLSTKPKWSHNGSLQRLSGTCPGTGSENPDCYFVIQFAVALLTVSHCLLLALTHSLSHSVWSFCLKITFVPPIPLTVKYTHICLDVSAVGKYISQCIIWQK